MPEMFFGRGATALQFGSFSVFGASQNGPWLRKKSALEAVSPAGMRAATPWTPLCLAKSRSMMRAVRSRCPTSLASRASVSVVRTSVGRPCPSSSSTAWRLVFSAVASPSSETGRAMSA